MKNINTYILVILVAVSIFNTYKILEINKKINYMEMDILYNSTGIISQGSKIMNNFRMITSLNLSTENLDFSIYNEN